MTNSTPKRSAKGDYVDNKKLYTALVIYKTAVNKAAADNVQKPRIPEYVGECIMKIAHHLSLSKNFVNYPFREDMIGDAYENCIKYLDNFNPDKYDNPFAYITQISYYAFVNRIKKEKRQLYVKQKSLENAYLFGILEENQATGTPITTVDLDNDYMTNLVKDFEDKIAANKKKTKPKKGVEKFYEDEDGEE